MNILVLSPTLKRSKMIRLQFFDANLDQVKYEPRSSDELYYVSRNLLDRFGLLEFKDGTILDFKSVSQGPETFLFRSYGQVFTEVHPDDISERLYDILSRSLGKSTVPEEFQWTFLEDS